MTGRSFLDVARDLIRGTAEAHSRSSAGREYYALMIEARDLLQRWGVSTPPKDKTHHVIRHRFHASNDPVLVQTARELETLARLRNHGDYDTATIGPFATDAAARNAIQVAANAVVILDSINADSVRRQAAIVAIKKMFP